MVCVAKNNGIPPQVKICPTFVVADIHLAFIDVLEKENVSLEMCVYPTRQGKLTVLLNLC